MTTSQTGSPTDNSHFYYPAASTTPQYDFDGNLVYDGRWTYTWDAENRLIGMEITQTAETSGHPYRKLTFSYDWQGRRVARSVWHGTRSTPALASSQRWLYDGWNPVTEFTATAGSGVAPTRSLTLTWGIDLSGSLQGAGGVGGLLACRTLGSPAATHHPCFDGNGNVVGWLKEGDSALEFRREFDPFGNPLVEEGAEPVAIGFSTKMRDEETGLLYYGYRWYDPATGRWPSRDPIEEEGGLNLYGFVNNDGADWVDLLGQKFEQHDTRHVRTLPNYSIINATRGVTPHRGIMRIGCKCDDADGKWWPDLEAFLVQAYILVRTHLRYMGRDYELTEKFQQSVLAHEQGHVNNIRLWHDAALPLAKTEFSKEKKFDAKKGCSDYIDSREKFWINKYDKEVKLAEYWHKNGPRGLGSPRREHFVDWDANRDPYTISSFDAIPDNDVEYVGFRGELNFVNTTQ